MDQKEFDDLVKGLTSESSRRRVVGTGLGAAAAAFVAAASDMAGKAKGKDDRKKGKDAGGKKVRNDDRKKRGSGKGTTVGGDDRSESRACIETRAKCLKKKNGKKRNRCNECCSQLNDGKTCICLVDGGACTANANCCNGTCTDGVCGGGPEPTCRELGQTCKNIAGGCCEGLTCGSGQGGESDVACYVPAGGACTSTSECVHRTVCIGGTCGFLS